jgi:MFS family permease
MSTVVDMKNIRFWPVMTAIFFGSFLTFLSINMINIALPALIEDFHSSLSTMQWTLTGFMLTLGTIAPLTGYLGDKFGYKRVYLFAMIGFTAFSLLCGFCMECWLTHCFPNYSGDVQRSCTASYYDYNFSDYSSSEATYGHQFVVISRYACTGFRSDN